MTEIEPFADKAVVMKATIKDSFGNMIATASKKETGAIGRALAMCGYGTLQASEFDEQDRLADVPVEKSKTN